MLRSNGYTSTTAHATQSQSSGSYPYRNLVISKQGVVRTGKDVQGIIRVVDAPVEVGDGRVKAKDC